MNSMRFSNTVVLVAGGTGGLGRAVSLAFLKEGARVAVTYRSRDEFAALQAAAGTSQSLLDGYEADATDETSVGRLFENILAQYGRLDAMVNAIGAYAGGAKLWEGSIKIFDQMLALNLRTGLVLSRAVVPLMLKKDPARLSTLPRKRLSSMPPETRRMRLQKPPRLQ